MEIRTQSYIARHIFHREAQIVHDGALVYIRLVRVIDRKHDIDADHHDDDEERHRDHGLDQCESCS